MLITSTPINYILRNIVFTLMPPFPILEENQNPSPNENLSTQVQKWGRSSTTFIRTPSIQGFILSFHIQF